MVKKKTAPVPRKVSPRKASAPVAPPPSKPLHAMASNRSGALTLSAYRGDSSVLLAFDVDKNSIENLAGFAVKCTLPNGTQIELKNRLNFATAVTPETTAAQRRALLTPTSQAPYQKFRWIDFTSSAGPGQYIYEVTAMYFDTAPKLRAGDTVTVPLSLGPYQSGNLRIGFTRGFLSSQAYVDHFKNAPIRPAAKSITYSTTPFADQYTWLGFNARTLIFDFLNNALKNGSSLDLFAYDLDEPDIIKLLAKFGTRLRAFLDDAPLHTKPGAMEILAKKALIASKAQVKTGHFQRFAHDKVFIEKDAKGNPLRVLTGSANFSVRGLYVQANNVLTFDDVETATHYEEVFELSFQDMSHFKTSDMAESWIDMDQQPGLPPFSVAFSPHSSASISLDRVSAAIKNAKSSILFAIMDVSGGGDVLKSISDLTNSRPDLYSYGVTQGKSGTMLFKPGSPNGILTSFAILQKQIPFPFSAETSGGPGQVIHDKFIVIDFDTDHPLVYTGSSNLAKGGEEANGDNLLEIQDAGVASIFAVQAMGLVDHFHFRVAVQESTAATPLTLRTDDWYQPYYKAGDIKMRERQLFAKS